MTNIHCYSYGGSA